jgi:predicted small metal-binding protein
MAKVNDPKHPETGTTHTSSEKHYSFRCADVGLAECQWQTNGSTPEEIMRNAEEHGRSDHNLTEINEDLRKRIKQNIKHAA